MNIPGWKARRKRTVVFLLSILVTLSFFETIIRYAGSIEPGKRSPAYDFEPKNTYGFRDDEYARDKPPGCFRIMGIGDSFSWGHGIRYDDSVFKRLERRLRRRPGGGAFQVLNCSRCGSSTHQETALLRPLLRDFDPDLVIWGFCLNDTEDHRDMASFEAYRRFVFPRHPEGIQSVLCRFSALYHFIYCRLDQTRVRKAMIRYYHGIYQEDYPGYPLFLKSIQEAGYLINDRGIPAVLFIFPLFQFPLDDGYPFFKEHEKVKKAAEQHYFHVLDLFSLYRDLDTDYLMVNPPADPHPNEIAHRMAAERIEAFLEENNLLPHPLPD